MFWDNVAWVYDIFADGINRKANRKLCKVVAGLISPTDDVLECACGTGLLPQPDWCAGIRPGPACQPAPAGRMYRRLSALSSAPKARPEVWSGA